MDVLTLSGLKYHANHGYYASEREDGNDFEVDLVFYADLGHAGASDNLTETIDYQQAEQIVSKVMNGHPVKLIETLATNIGEEIFSHFTIVRTLEVRIRKLHPPIGTEAAHAQIVRTWKR